MLEMIHNTEHARAHTQSETYQFLKILSSFVHAKKLFLESYAHTPRLRDVKKLSECEFF